MTFSVRSDPNRLVEATIPHMIPLIINITPVFLSIEFQLNMLKTVQKSIWLLIRLTESKSAALETAHLEIPGKKTINNRVPILLFFCKRESIDAGRTLQERHKFRIWCKEVKADGSRVICFKTNQTD